MSFNQNPLRYLNGNETVSGNLQVLGNEIINGNLTVNGTTNIGTVTFDNLTVSSVTAGTGVLGVAYITTGYYTSLTGSSVTAGTVIANTGIFNNLVFAASSITNLTATNLNVSHMTGTLVEAIDLHVSDHLVVNASGAINMTGDANIQGNFTTQNASVSNLSVNGGASIGGELTVGYNGMQVVGLAGSTSIEVLAGDVILGSDIPGTLLNFGNEKIQGNLSVTGTINANAITTSSIVATSATISNLSLAGASLTNLSATNFTGTNAVIATLTGTNLQYLSASTTNLTVQHMTGSLVEVRDLRVSDHLVVNATGSISLTGDANIQGNFTTQNASVSNLSVDGGASIGGELTVGYNGMQVIGLAGTTSVEVLSGDVILGSSIPGTVLNLGSEKIQGNLSVTGALTVGGLLTASSFGASTITATTGIFTNATITNATITNETVANLTATGLTKLATTLVTGNMSMTGDANIQGNFTTQNAQVENLAVNAGVSVGGELSVGYSGMQVIGLAGTTSVQVLSGDVILGQGVAGTLLNFGNEKIQGNLSVTGAVNVGGALTASSLTVPSLTVPTLSTTTLTATNATITNETVTNLTATGLTKLVDTLVSGNVSMTGNANIQGNFTTQNADVSNLSVNGGASIGGELTVGYNGMQVIGLSGINAIEVLAGDVVLGSDMPGTLLNFGNEKIQGNLSVTGAVNVGGVLTASSLNVPTITATTGTITNATITNATITNETVANLTATSTTKLVNTLVAGNVSMTGDANIQGNFTTQNASVENLSVNAGVSVGGELTVGYSGMQVIGLAGSTSVQVISGDVILGQGVAGTLLNFGDEKIQGNLSVTGAVNVGGALTASSLTIPSLTVPTISTTTLTATNATITNLTATSVSKIVDTLVSGNVSMTGNANIQGNFTTQNADVSNLSVNGGASIGGELTVGYNGMQVVGLAGTTSLEVLSGDIILGSDVPATVLNFGNEKVQGNLSVTGTINVGGTLTAAGTVNATLLQSSNASFTNATITNLTGSNVALAFADINVQYVGSLTGSRIGATVVNSSMSTIQSLTGVNILSNNVNSNFATVGILTGTNINTSTLAINDTLSVRSTSFNAMAGQVTLASGINTVSNTLIGASDYIFVSRMTGTAANLGYLQYSINAGSDFSIVSSNGSDDSIVSYMIVKNF